MPITDTLTHYEVDQFKDDGEVFSKAYSRLNRWEN